MHSVTLVQDVPLRLPFSIRCGCQFFRRKLARVDSGIERVRVIARCAQHSLRQFSRGLVSIPSTASVTVDHLQVELLLAFRTLCHAQKPCGNITGMPSFQAHNVFQVLNEVERCCAAGDTSQALAVIVEYRRRSKAKRDIGTNARRMELKDQRLAKGLCRCGRTETPAGTSCRQCRIERADRYHAKKRASRRFEAAA